MVAVQNSNSSKYLLLYAGCLSLFKITMACLKENLDFGCRHSGSEVKWQILMFYGSLGVQWIKKNSLNGGLPELEKIIF